MTTSTRFWQIGAYRLYEVGEVEDYREELRARLHELVELQRYIQEVKAERNRLIQRNKKLQENVNTLVRANKKKMHEMVKLHRRLGTLELEEDGTPVH